MEPEMEISNIDYESKLRQHSIRLLNFMDKTDESRKAADRAKLDLNAADRFRLSQVTTNKSENSKPSFKKEICSHDKAGIFANYANEYNYYYYEQQRQQGEKLDVYHSKQLAPTNSTMIQDPNIYFSDPQHYDATTGNSTPSRRKRRCDYLEQPLDIHTYADVPKRPRPSQRSSSKRSQELPRHFPTQHSETDPTNRTRPYSNSEYPSHSRQYSRHGTNSDLSYRRNSMVSSSLRRNSLLLSYSRRNSTLSIATIDIDFDEVLKDDISFDSFAFENLNENAFCRRMSMNSMKNNTSFQCYGP